MDAITNQKVSTTTPAPESISGWNWGAAGLSWIWGIRFKVWIAFVAFVPIVGQIWWIVLGIKGNEWAQKQNPGIPVDELKRQLKPWNTWGLVFFIVSILGPIVYVALLSGIGLSSLNSAESKARDAKRKSDVVTISTGVILYYDDHQNAYPNAISDIGSQYLTIPQPPLASETYGYSTSADHKHFLVYTKLESDKQYYYTNDQSIQAEQASIPSCSVTCP